MPEGGWRARASSTSTPTPISPWSPTASVRASSGRASRPRSSATARSRHSRSNRNGSTCTPITSLARDRTDHPLVDRLRRLRRRAPRTGVGDQRRAARRSRHVARRGHGRRPAAGDPRRDAPHGGGPRPRPRTGSVRHEHRAHPRTERLRGLRRGREPGPRARSAGSAVRHARPFRAGAEVRRRRGGDRHRTTDRRHRRVQPPGDQPPGQLGSGCRTARAVRSRTRGRHRHLLRRLPVRRVLVVADAVPAAVAPGRRHRGDASPAGRTRTATASTRRHDRGLVRRPSLALGPIPHQQQSRRVRHRQDHRATLGRGGHRAVRTDAAALRALRQRTPGRALLPQRGRRREVPRPPAVGDRVGRQCDPAPPADGMPAPPQLRHVPPRARPLCPPERCARTGRTRSRR